VAEALVSRALRDARDLGFGRSSVRVVADGSSDEFAMFESAGFVTNDTQVHYSIEL
jgi:mycothiol synthase